MRRKQHLARLLCGIVWASLWMLVPHCVQGQEPSGAPEPEELPQSIREAYERAEKFGEEAIPPMPPASATGDRNSRRLDLVHVVGLVGGSLLVANLAIGTAIFLGARRRRLTVPARKIWRKWHYAVGLTALALALAHAIGRFMQAGELNLDNPPAFLLACATVLIVGSGLLRVRPPRKLARYPQLWVWAHRALALLTLVLLVMHLGQ